MPCPTSFYAPLYADPLSNQIAPPDRIVQETSSNHLIVSNAPETISVAEGANTLYKTTLQMGSGVSTVRVYMWHLNISGEPLTFGVLATPQLFASVRAGRKIVQNGIFPDLSVPGICLAGAQLYRTLEPLPVPGFITGETLLFEATTPNNGLLGAVLEFDVDASTAPVMDFRTALKLNGSYGAFSADSRSALDPAEGHVHIRGSWPRLAATMEILPTLHVWDVNPLTSTPLLCGICESGGPELDPTWGFGHHASDPDGTQLGNKGCYGVDLTYRVGVINTGPASNGRFWAYLEARNNQLERDGPGAYWGAGRLISPELEPALAVPKIFFRRPVGYPPNYPRLVDLETLNEPIYVNGNVSLAFQIANGGASPLPVQLVLRPEHLSTQPAEYPH